MQPAIIPPLYHTRNDTWEGLEIGPVLFDTGPPPFELVSCRLYFKNKAKVLYKLKSDPGVGEGTINIVDPITWEIVVPKQDLPLMAGGWAWDFETTDSEGTILTIYQGTMIVEEDITHDD